MILMNLMNKTELVIFLAIFLVGVVAGIYFFATETVDSPPINDGVVDIVPLDNSEHVVNLYYYNPELDEDEEGNILCSGQGLVPVERVVKSDDNIVEKTIRLLIYGNLNEREIEDGITTEFPLSGFELISADSDNGMLTLVFEDPEFATSGGSCRVGILWAQIEKTALQFPGVEEVRFLPEELFQP